VSSQKIAEGQVSKNVRRLVVERVHLFYPHAGGIVTTESRSKDVAMHHSIS